jgi:hypothetical protein
MLARDALRAAAIAAKSASPIESSTRQHVDSDATRPNTTA